MCEVGTGSKLRRILANQRFRLGRAGRRLRVDLDFRWVQPVQVVLVGHYFLDFRSVPVVPLVLGLLKDLLVLGMRLNEFRLDQAVQVVLELPVVHLVQHLRLVLQVPVVLGLLLVLVRLAVHLVRVVLLGHQFLVVRVVLLGKIDSWCLVVGMVLRFLLGHHHFRVVRADLVVLADQLVLVVQVGLEGMWVRSGDRTGNELAKLLQLDAFDGRCC